jgi:hypothetical protein
MFERAPGLFHALQLLVTQGEVRRGEAIVVAMDHEFAVETFFFPLLRRVNPQQAAFGQPEIATVAAARPQLTHPLGMPFTPHLVEGRQFGFELTQEFLAMGSLPFLFLGVRERLILGSHAASCWGASRNPGYHSRNVASQSPFNTRVRICRRRWAPRGVQAICCFLQKRLLMT